MAEELPFTKKHPHIHLQESFKNHLSRIIQRWDNKGVVVGRMFATALEDIANQIKDCSSKEELLAFIKSKGLIKSIIYPIPYKEHGLCNSNDMFFEYQLIRGEEDRFYGAIGMFFPSLFESTSREDLGYFCRDHENKSKNFNNAEFYFATYSD